MLQEKELAAMTIEELQKGYRDKRFSVKQVIQTYLQRIHNLDYKIGAFITISNETALEQAELLDQKLNRGGDIGPLGGIPVAIKDNICTQGIRTSCASKMLEHFVPSYDAKAVQLLKDAGAIIIGKTNTSEFAIDTASCISPLQITCNPWDINKVAGCSGGSAAALAAGFVPLTLGTDAGGSIRRSASYCGVVGLKPTYGAVSRYGLTAIAPSLEQIGPMTRRVKDCALAYYTIKKSGLQDDTNFKYDNSTDYLNALDGGVQGFKIGIPEQCLDQVNDEIAETLLEAARQYKQSGAQVGWFSLPEIDSSLAAYYVISSAEAATNLARYDGIRYGYRTEEMENLSLSEFIRRNRSEGFGEEVQRMILLGTCVQTPEYSPYYQKAVKIRSQVSHAVKEAFKSFDLILMPTSPVLPFDTKNDEKYLYNQEEWNRFTVIMNLAGIPAISFPGGFSREGLPIGLQLAGDHFMEHKLFKAAYCLERGLGIFLKSACVEGEKV